MSEPNLLLVAVVGAVPALVVLVVGAVVRGVRELVRCWRSESWLRAGSRGAARAAAQRCGTAVTMLHRAEREQAAERERPGPPQPLHGDGSVRRVYSAERGWRS